MGKRAEENKRRILNRYGLIVFFLLGVGVMIIFSAGKIAFSAEGKKWREVGERETIIKDRVILPKRGNLHYDGKLLATSERSQYLYGFLGGRDEEGYIDEIC